MILGFLFAFKYCSTKEKTKKPKSDRLRGSKPRGLSLFDHVMYVLTMTFLELKHTWQIINFYTESYWHTHQSSQDKTFQRNRIRGYVLLAAITRRYPLDYNKGLISPKTFPFLADLESQWGSYLPPFTPARKSSCIMEQRDHPCNSMQKPTRSLSPTILSGMSYPVQKRHTWSNSSPALLLLLMPHLRECLKTAVLPLSPWKAKSTPKGKPKQQLQASCTF